MDLTCSIVSAALVVGTIYGLTAHYEGFNDSFSRLLTAASSSALFWILLVAALSTAGSKHLFMDLRERLLIGCVLYFAWSFVLFVVYLPFRPPYGPNA